MEAFKGNISVDVLGFPTLAAVWAFGLDQAQPKAVWILKGEMSLTKAFVDIFMTDIKGCETFLPEVQATFRNGIADLGGHTRPVFSLSDIFPGEESQNSAGRSHFVTEVEMVGLRIVKI